MAISKIILNGVTQMDLTQDTVEASNLLSSYTAHKADGTAVTGTATSSPTLQTKSVSPTESSQTVTPDSGYDGLSSVSVGAISTTYVGSQVPRFTLTSDWIVTPTETQTEVMLDGEYLEGGDIYVGAISSTYVGTGITRRSSSDLTVSGNTVTAPAGYYASSASATTSGGTSMNVQVAQSTSRATSSTYTNLISLTCSTAGTYDIYWDCFRSSTGGTSGSQLYIGGSAYGTANTTFTNHAQTNHLTGVTLAANQTVAVYARSRGSNYYSYVGTLVIKQTA